MDAPKFPIFVQPPRRRKEGREEGDDNGIAQKMASAVASLRLREKGAVVRGRDRGSSFFGI